MRALRFITLLIVLAVAWIATPTFDLRPFAALLPTDFMADAALLQQFRRWVAVDIAPISLLLTGCAALTFGLLATPWPFAEAHVRPAIAQHQTDGTGTHRGRWWGGVLLLLVALAGTVGVLFGQQARAEAPTMHLVWVASTLLLLLAAALLTPPSVIVAQQVPVLHDASHHRFNRPGVGWRILLPVLIFALVLYSWKLTTLPAVVDDTIAQVGLQALAMARGEPMALFGVDPTLSRSENQRVAAAVVPTALLVWLTGDLLLSTRLIGLFAALLCAGATWLVAVELFARRPAPSGAAVPIEDNGRSLAIVATWLVIVNSAVLSFSRQPVLMEAVAWGMLGCWALLRGMRTDDRLAISLSGVLLGVGYLFHSDALIFILTTLLWWLGFGAAQVGLLPHLAPVPRANRRLGGAFALWMLGLFVITAPLLGARAQEMLRWFDQLPPSLSRALIGLWGNFVPSVTTYPAPLYNLVLLPLFPLMLGLLLFNLDRRQGWMIISWISSALLVAALFPSQSLRWELLLPLVPALALALAFTLDRLRVTLILAGGRWTQQFLTYFLLGLLLWIGFQNVTTYYAFVLRQHEPTSMIGYALRALPAEQTVLVHLSPAGAPLTAVVAETAPTHLLLRFLTNDTLDSAESHVRFVAALPPTVDPGTVVLLLPEDTATLAFLRSAYPTSTLVVQRDILANPLLLLYTVGDPAQ